MMLTGFMYAALQVSNTTKTLPQRDIKRLGPQDSDSQFSRIILRYEMENFLWFLWTASDVLLSFILPLLFDMTTRIFNCFKLS